MRQKVLLVLIQQEGKYFELKNDVKNNVIVDFQILQGSGGADDQSCFWFVSGWRSVTVLPRSPTL